MAWWLMKSEPEVYGIDHLAAEGTTLWDGIRNYFDPRSSRDQPRWDCVRLAYRGRFAQLLSLEELRSGFSVEELAVVRRGNRLSILPVADAIAARLLETLGPVQA